MTTKKASIYIRNLNPNTKRQFKEYCARKGVTMEAAISALIQRAIRQDNVTEDAGKQ